MFWVFVGLKTTIQLKLAKIKLIAAGVRGVFNLRGSKNCYFIKSFQVSEECFSEPECEEVCTPVTARWLNILNFGCIFSLGRNLTF